MSSIGELCEGEEVSGPGAVFDAVLALSPGALTDAEVAEVMVTIDGLRRRLDAVAVSVTGVFDARCTWAADGARSAAGWMTVRTDRSHRACNDEVRVSRVLRCMPVVEEAALAGRLGREKVRALAWARQEGLEEAFAACEADLVADVASTTVLGAWRYLRRWVDLAKARLGVNDPDGPEPKDGVGGSKVTLGQGLEGRWFGTLDLRGEDGEVLANAIDHVIENWWHTGVFHTDDGLTNPERKARALVEVITRGSDGGDRDGTAKPLILALVDAATLMGFSPTGTASSGVGGPFGWNVSSAGNGVTPGPSSFPDGHPGSGDRGPSGGRRDGSGIGSPGPGSRADTAARWPSGPGTGRGSPSRAGTTGWPSAGGTGPEPGVTGRAGPDAGTGAGGSRAAESPGAGPLGGLGVLDRLTVEQAALMRLCELSRSGPVSTATMQRLACEGTIVPVIIGADGDPLHMGREIRLFNREQRRALRIRDGHCVFAGCTVSAEQCVAHHLHYWDHGGPTDIDNGALVCPFHHRLVHNNGFTLRRRDDGRFVTTRPDGTPITGTHPTIGPVKRRRPPPGPHPGTHPDLDPDPDDVYLTRCIRNRIDTLIREAEATRARVDDTRDPVPV